MVDITITGYGSIDQVSSDDLMEIVDVSDNTTYPNGKNKKTTVEKIRTNIVNNTNTDEISEGSSNLYVSPTEKQTLNNIDINTVDNIGTGEQLVKGVNNRVAEIRSIEAGTGINTSIEGDNLKITSIDNPTGSIVVLATETVPSELLECDGSLLDQSTFSNLFGIVSSTFVTRWSDNESISIGELRKSIADATIYEATTSGTTSGTDIGDDIGVTWIVSSQFQLPDLRGEFIRGYDNGRGIDVGREFGTWQEDTLQNITGSITLSSLSANTASGAFFYTQGSNTTVGAGGSTERSNFNFDASRVARTSDQTKPRNIALKYCIKY